MSSLPIARISESILAYIFVHVIELYIGGFILYRREGGGYDVRGRDIESERERKEERRERERE